MLDVRTPERNWLFPYVHFLYAEWGPSKNMIVMFATHQIQIAGQNLMPIYEALSRQSLTQVELKRSHTSIKDGDTWIDNIRVLKTTDLDE